MRLVLINRIEENPLAMKSGDILLNSCPLCKERAKTPVMNMDGFTKIVLHGGNNEFLEKMFRLFSEDGHPMQNDYNYWTELGGHA